MLRQGARHGDIPNIIFVMVVEESVCIGDRKRCVVPQRESRTEPQPIGSLTLTISISSEQISHPHAPFPIKVCRSHNRKTIGKICWTIPRTTLNHNQCNTHAFPIHVNTLFKQFLFTIAGADKHSSARQARRATTNFLEGSSRSS